MVKFPSCSRSWLWPGLGVVFTSSLRKVNTAGCVHPDYEGTLPGPAAYLRWYSRNGPVRDPAAPTVAVLLYRKHVRAGPAHYLTQA